MSTPGNPLSLAHWRRTMAALVRRSAGGVRGSRTRIRHVPCCAGSTLSRARRQSHSLCASSALAWCVMVSLRRSMADQGCRQDRSRDRSTFEMALAADGVTRFTRVANVEFAVRGAAYALALYWLEGYGGGLWLPFGDSTNGTSTYGGGRYLYDTIKGADLGASADRVRARFQFRLQPVMHLRRSLVVSIAARREQIAVRGRGGGAGFRSGRPDRLAERSAGEPATNSVRSPRLAEFAILTVL